LEIEMNRSPRNQPEFDHVSRTSPLDPPLRLAYLAERGKWAPIAAAVVLVACSNSWARQALWEVEVKPHEALKLGALKAVRGIAVPQGVRYTLKKLTTSMPVQLTLVSVDPAQDVKLEVYKDTWDAPLTVLSSKDADGAVTLRFRSNDHVAWAVRGPPRAPYQLLVWVGPEIQQVARMPLVTSQEYERRTGKKVVYGRADAELEPPPLDTLTTVLPQPPVTPASKPVATPVPPPAGDSMTVWIVLLLAAILVALTVIAVLLMRGKGKGAAILLLACGVAILASSFAGSPVAAEDADPPVSDADLAPSNLEPADYHQKMNEALDQLRTITGGFSGSESSLPSDQLARFYQRPGQTDAVREEIAKKAGATHETFNKGLKDLMAMTNTLMLFMEQFGFITPREAAVAPNYDLKDAPPLPIESLSDPTGTARASLRDYDTIRDYQKALKLLEDQYVIYKQTMLQAGRIVELADAAAGLSSIAKLKWTIDKANPNLPANRARDAFFAAYDANYAKLMDMLNRALVEIAACEEKHYGAKNWYNIYALPYYLYIRDRYRRSP
jgi:hypothetical protein